MLNRADTLKIDRGPVSHLTLKTDYLTEIKMNVRDLNRSEVHNIFKREM